MWYEQEIEQWAGAWYDGVDYSWRFEVSTYGRIRNAKNKRIYSLHIYFVKLFQKELAERNNKFKCTLDAKWDYEVGWIYFTSIKEYKAVLAELDRTRYERYMNGFVPLCDRWEWRMQQRSKSAEAFAILRELRENFYLPVESNN